MILPDYIRQETEKLSEKYKPTELKKLSARLTEVYAENKSDGTRLVTTEEQAAVYSIVRMPATYAAVYSALNAATDGDGSGFETMLDIGAGTGAAFFAAHELLGINKATLVEREKNMLSLAKKFCATAELNAEFIKSDALSFDTQDKFDLVTTSYALNEFDKPAREKLLDKLLSCTKKLLLIVEPGTPKAFSLQKEIRNYLIGKGARLTAPCPSGAVCSLPQEDWCHFTCRIERSRLHKFVKGGDSPFEDEKFTYSAFCADNSLAPCKGRILRHPVTDKGKITLSVCTEKGAETITLFKKDDAYKSARKLGAGDRIEL